MKLTAILMLCACLQLSAKTSGQAVTLSVKNTPMKEVFREIQKQTGLNILVSEKLLARAGNVTVNVKDMPVDQVLDLCFKNKNLTFSIVGGTIVVKPEFNSSLMEEVEINNPPPPIDLRGRVTNEKGEPLEGVTVTIKGTKKGTATNRQGQFTLHVEGERVHLTITSVGYAPITVLVQGNKLTVDSQSEAAHGVTEGNARSSASMDQNGFISVKLVQLIKEADALVITGIVNKRKESFTGSAATYSQKELMQVGGTNILQSLKTLDPAFGITDNVQLGSDPNRLPDLEIRGKTSLIGTRDAISIDPNQPLFILDGFESSLAIINDLDINRVESITILKDAASTAIYGSKAANGVVVVETIKPKAGKLMVSYRGLYDVTAPDLTSYNLMDAAEKVEFERLSGRFDRPNRLADLAMNDLVFTQMYHDRLRMLAEGINSDWLAEPLRVGLNQAHSLSVEGGEGNFTFGLNGGYNGTTGVMKESNRNRYNGNINVVYRIPKFQFSNNFSVQTALYQNPIVPFREYASTNPYYKKTNNGVVEQWLEFTPLVQVGNPLWNASRNSRDKGQDMQLRNFFNSEWRPSGSWRVNARLGLTWNNNNSEIFTSPEDTREMIKEINRRGTFSTTNSQGNILQGDITVNYNRLVNKHRIHLAGGSNIVSGNTLVQGYSVEGFPNASGNFTYPNFSRGFPANSRPTYRDNISRSLNGYFIGNYAFDDRYAIDLSLRTNGSSVFGNNRQFSKTWSVGLSWNLHREEFIRSNMRWINLLRIRGSVGNPGNQNFSSNQTLLTYRFGSVQSYFGLPSMPGQLGNPDLEWEITRDHNIGMNLTAFNNRFSIIADFHYRVTSPQLITHQMPLSSGSTTLLTNGGGQINQGLNFSSSYQILQNTKRRILWSIRVTGSALNKTEIYGIGKSLDDFNNKGKGSSTTRYFDGADPYDVWAVRSMGIDPSNGKELFLTKDGKYTYDFSYDNEVNIGNSRPDMHGIVGSNLTLGGFAVNLNFRYQFGAEVFNNALFGKVENVDMRYNQDSRALYDRWHKPGDIRHFKNIRDINRSPISSRFVQTDKSFILESVYAEYEFRDGWVKRAGLGNFKVFASARDVMRLSTIQVERGIDYPFARFINAGLSFNF